MVPPQPSMVDPTIHRVVDLEVQPLLKTPSYPPVSSIPPTSSSRLEQATPSGPIPEGPIPSPSSTGAADADVAGTVLYLAYGSNLASEIFLGRRGIRPLSRISVSAPSLRLVFDLSAIPYWDPCFANSAPRKVPKIPDRPPKLPDPPDLPLPPPPYRHNSNSNIAPYKDDGDLEKGDLARDTGAKLYRDDDDDDDSVHRTSRGDPEWDQGLLGAVYEVTPADYAHILATEAAEYVDVLVPCIPLPPNVGVPEKPPIPPLPRPFLAHTLFAPPPPPSSPPSVSVPGRGHLATSSSSDDNDKGGGGDGTTHLPGWALKFLLPYRRPDPDYPQPSARYLDLLRDGAREHELPREYQAWLASLGAYRVTSLRQRVGSVLFLALWAPFLLILLLLGRALSRWGGGRGKNRRRQMQLWLAVGHGVVFRGLWRSYDVFFKPVFGDGERTQDDGDGGGLAGRQMAARFRGGGRSWDDEKLPLR